MKLSMFSPKVFLASAAESPTGVMALDGLESSTQKLCQLFTFNSAASATEKEISAFDDVPLIEGVDHLIAGKTDKEACGLLRRMVLDLMK
jgi:hypothetical protein